MNQQNKESYVIRSLANQSADAAVKIAERDAIITEQYQEIEQLKKELEKYLEKEIEEMDEEAEKRQKKEGNKIKNAE